MGKFWPYIIIGIIIVAIIGYANPQFFPGIKDKVSEITRKIPIDNQVKIPLTTKTIVIEEDKSLISSCKRSFNECVDISTKKYDISISLLEIQEFNNKEDAEDFYNTWKGFLEFYSPLDEEKYPLVLLALTIKNPQTKMPFVVVCNQQGELTQSSKERLFCG